MVEATIPAAGENAPAPIDTNAGSINEPGAGETITLQQRPEWVPEKFFKDGVVNFKDMAKSYAELEKGKSVVPAAENKPIIPAQAAENTPAPIQAPMAIPGVDAPSVAKYTDELSTNGKLSDESYAALQKAGYPKIVVDSYIKGLTADADRDSAVSEARIADKQIAEIQTSVGGENVMKEMLAWAVANVEPTDLDDYNKAVCSSDVAQVKLAVNGMFHAFSQAQHPELLQGDRKGEFTTVEPFLSNDEVVTAMNNPKYDRDPAYRAQVAERLRVSNAFQQSRDLKEEKRADGRFASYQS